MSNPHYILPFDVLCAYYGAQVYFVQPLVTHGSAPLLEGSTVSIDMDLLIKLENTKKDPYEYVRLILRDVGKLDRDEAQEVRNREALLSETRDPTKKKVERAKLVRWLMSMGFHIGLAKDKTFVYREDNKLVDPITQEIYAYL